MQRTSQEQGTSRAAFVKGINSDTFEIRFTLVDHTIGLAFAGLDGYSWNMVKLSRDKDSPVPFAMRDGVLSSSGLTGTYTAANYRFIAAGTPRPFKVTYDGTTLSVFTGANPGDVDNWAAAYTTTSYSPTGGDLLGFVTSAEVGVQAWVDDLSIKLDTDGNGSYDSTETIERFTIDASGYAPQGVKRGRELFSRSLASTAILAARSPSRAGRIMEACCLGDLLGPRLLAQRSSLCLAALDACRTPLRLIRVSARCASPTASA